MHKSIDVVNAIMRLLEHGEEGITDEVYSAVAVLLQGHKMANVLNHLEWSFISSVASSTSIVVEIKETVQQGDMLCVNYGGSYWDDYEDGGMLTGSNRTHLMQGNEMLGCMDDNVVGSVVFAKRELPRGCELKYMNAVLQQNFMTTSTMQERSAKGGRCAFVLSVVPGLHIWPEPAQLEHVALCPDANGPCNVLDPKTNTTVTNKGAITIILDLDELYKNMTNRLSGVVPMLDVGPFVQTPKKLVQATLEHFSFVALRPCE